MLCLLWNSTPLRRILRQYVMITLLPYSLYTFNICPRQQFFVAYLNKGTLELFLLLLFSFVLVWFGDLLIFFLNLKKTVMVLSALQCDRSEFPRRVNMRTKMRTLNTAALWRRVCEHSAQDFREFSREADLTWLNPWFHHHAQENT